VNILEEIRKRLFYGEAISPTETAGEPAPPAQREGQGLEAHAARWLIERESRVRQSPQFERALKAITDCEKEWPRGRDLAGPLAAFACLAVSPNRPHRKSWQKLWALETGKTWKALKDFPKRLRSMADEVKRVNASVFFSPAQIANAKTLKAEIVRKRFNQLPGIMHVYAAALEAHIARVPDLTAKSLPQASGGGHSHWIVLLSYTVKLATGKWRDREVAEFLNVTARALGELRPEEEDRFDALTIAQARSRFKKKPKT
jgi:hypothetical protein